MLDLTIKTISHDQQRYPTVGDYQTKTDPILTDISKTAKNELAVDFTISDMQDWRYEVLVAIHELVEKALTKERGISEEAITAFDIEYENKRELLDCSEPGDCKLAPYHKEHVIATEIEKQVAMYLRVDWQEYTNVVCSL